MPTQQQVEILAAEVGVLLRQHGCQLVTAESCTGGWIAQAMTAVPGSSEWFWGAYVTYTNATKEHMLGVDAAVLEQYGAVSREVALQMAEGALRNSNVGTSIAVTGLAGPDGGSDDLPVGTVWIAWGVKGRPAVAKRFCFDGDRQAVRLAVVAEALTGVRERL
ncbi:CinA family protein [Endozoicomonadaceae bacterium StTr2]